MAAGVMPAATNARPLYTNLYSGEAISSLSVSSQGMLTLLPGFPLAVGGYVQALTVSPDGRHLVAQFPFSTDHFLQAYSLDGAGGMTQIGGNTAVASSSPIIFSPGGTHLYMASDTGGVIALAFTAGAFTPLGTSGSLDASDIAITPDGRFLFAADYNNAQIARYAIQGDGSLSELSAAPALEDAGRSLKITPDGRFLVLVTAGLPSGHVSTYTIGADGSLTTTGSSVANSGASISRVAMGPVGRHLFVANHNEDSVSVVELAADGTLTRSTADVPSGVDSPAEAAVSNDGRFLFVGRSPGDYIQPFAIAADGSLSAIGAPIATGGISDGSTPQMHPAQPPTAKLAVTASMGPGELSTFSAVGSADSDGGSVSGYAWNFGDGATSTTQSANTDHRYANSGVYDVSVSAIDDEGCSASRIFDGQVTLCNGGPTARATASLDTPPSITSLKLTKRRFAPGKRVKIKFRLSEKSRVTLTFKKGRKRVGTLRLNGRSGANAVRFRGYLRRRALAPGRYTVNVVARDKKGGVSTVKRKRFRVV